MRILGVDPGTVQTGYGVIQEVNGSLEFLECGVVRTSSSQPIPQRLKVIYKGLYRVIEMHRPDVISIENIFIAQNVRSALKLGHARGAAILAAVNSNLEVFEYTPTEVKKAIAGFGRAGKEQVQHMVKQLLTLREIPEPHDASDALAMAICHSHCRKLKSRLKNL